MIDFSTYAQYFANCKVALENFKLIYSRNFSLPPEKFLSYLLEAPDKEQALNNFERFLEALKEKNIPFTIEEKETKELIFVIGSSSFLSGIIISEPSLLVNLITSGDYKREKNCHDYENMTVGASLGTFNELCSFLRKVKKREFLRIGYRDILKIATVEETMKELSFLASALLQKAYLFSLSELIKVYGEPYFTDSGEVKKAAEFVVIGMGKLGGFELNFSSDIDLIYIYSSDKGETEGLLQDGKRINQISLHSFFVKLSEWITKAISSVTSDGFVFRVDLRLRPEGERGDLANSLRSAEIYYESWGQTWERAALIKARPVAGSVKLGNDFIKMVEPFIFRRYLDYTTIEDIKDMKLKIDRELAKNGSSKRNVKLGKGGIREIEFFVQTMQLINGGRHSSLRDKSTLPALKLLLQNRFINERNYTDLREAYLFLRDVEHKIQIVSERQTHMLPSSSEEIAKLAKRLNLSAEQFYNLFEKYCENVKNIYNTLFFKEFSENKAEIPEDITDLLYGGLEEAEAHDRLKKYQIEDELRAVEIIKTIKNGPPFVRLRPKTRQRLLKIAPYILKESLDSPDPDAALLNVEKFLFSIGARQTLYALLDENKKTLKFLISLFGSSQFLSKIFISNPGILDSLVGSGYVDVHKEKSQMVSELDENLSRAADYEQKLNSFRRFKSLEILRIGINDIFGEIPMDEVNIQLTELAEVCLIKALQIASSELSMKYGIPSYIDGSGNINASSIAIIGMGKLGGRELNYNSDLDIIFVYSEPGETVLSGESKSFKSISNQEYFARLAQKVISILTLPTYEGFLYKIDTRLRPSGNAGPLVCSFESFRHYHETSARTWERQALIKARFITGETGFGKKIEKLINEEVYLKPFNEEIKNDIYNLRIRMEKEVARDDKNHYDIKAGSGGIVDVEFLVQYLQLKYGGNFQEVRSFNTLIALVKLYQKKVITDEEYKVLKNGYYFLRKIENRLRIVSDYSVVALSKNPSDLTKLAKRLGYTDDNPGKKLLDEYEMYAGGIREIFNNHFR